MKVKQGDTVKVMVGKDKDKIGEVIRVEADTNKVVVKGVNIITKHQKKRMNQAGQILRYEAPIHASNVLVKCPGSDTFSRVNYRINESGKKVRFSNKKGVALDQAFVKSSK